MKKFLFALSCLLCVRGSFAVENWFLDVVGLEPAYLWCVNVVEYAEAHDMHIEFDYGVTANKAICNDLYDSGDRDSLAWYAVAGADKIVRAKEEDDDACEKDALERYAKNFFMSLKSLKYLVNDINADIGAECSVKDNYCVVNLKLTTGSYQAQCIKAANPEFIRNSVDECDVVKVQWGRSANKYSDVPSPKHLGDFDADCNKIAES